MRTAMVKGRLVTAGPESPDLAVCPFCRGMIVKRKRNGQGGETTYFYRHKRGVGPECPRRDRLA
jgi:hypothetical protein